MKATNLEEHFMSSDMYVVIHHPGSFRTGKTLCAQLSACSGILWFLQVWIDPGR